MVQFLRFGKCLGYLIPASVVLILFDSIYKIEDKFCHIYPRNEGFLINLKKMHHIVKESIEGKDSM